MSSNKVKEKQSEITDSVINVPIWKMLWTMVPVRRADFSVSYWFISMFQSSHCNKFN